jgi:hypothetical protein
VLLLVIIGTVAAATLLLAVHAPPENESQHLSIAFAVAGVPTFTQYDIDTFGEALAHIPNREPEPESSESTHVEVETAGCSDPVAVSVTVHLDPRWLRAVRATRLHETLVLRTSYAENGRQLTLRDPQVQGAFGLAVKGRVSQLRAQFIAPQVQVPVSTEYLEGQGSNETIVTGVVPNAELPHISPTSDFQVASMQFTFLAPWISARGYQSCFLRLPSLVGSSILKEPFALHSIDNPSPRPDGPGEAQTEINTQADEINLQATNPAPNSSGPNRLWTCNRGSPEHPSPHAPDCHAIVVLNLPNQAAHLQLLTIILAAILSGAILAIGATLRRRFFAI